ncbi:MAG: sigma-54-dependent Fis family transcriptional regulator [Rhizobacter sp.]|nr:sigma-54-dependent Fis family transcriptional regulator [Rhizobacter sp.]
MAGALPGQLQRQADELRGTFVGSSPAFRAMLANLCRVAANDAPVLIEGQTGSGKELAARAIHYGGTRRDGPFVPVNCGALPDHLLEAELFGHERGAFTDAKTARRGLVAEANGGTLFLDEVDSLSPKAQVALLRFLQDQHYRPLGGTRELHTNVRMIAATNRPLQDAPRFRADLLYRLKILYLELPSLKDRPGDAQELAQHFVGVFSAKYHLSPKRFDEKTVAWIDRYDWPGNVRELENWVHRELLMTEGSVIAAHPAAPQSKCGATGPQQMACFHQAKAEAVRLFEHDYVVTLLRRTGGNVTRAAQIAGKERRAFGKLLKKHGIDRELLAD